jgi:hypothetical protein
MITLLTVAVLKRLTRSWAVKETLATYQQSVAKLGR